MVSDMNARVTAHEKIAERIKEMKNELVHLRGIQKALEKQTTPEGRAQAAEAAAATEECVNTLDGIQAEFNKLINKINDVDKSLADLDLTDYAITEAIDAKDIELPTPPPPPA